MNLKQGLIHILNWGSFLFILDAFLPQASISFRPFNPSIFAPFKAAYLVWDLWLIQTKNDKYKDNFKTTIVAFMIMFCLW